MFETVQRRRRESTYGKLAASISLHGLALFLVTSLHLSQSATVRQVPIEKTVRLSLPALRPSRPRRSHIPPERATPPQASLPEVATPRRAFRGPAPARARTELLPDISASLQPDVTVSQPLVAVQPGLPLGPPPVTVGRLASATAATQEREARTTRPAGFSAAREAPDSAPSAAPASRSSGFGELTQASSLEPQARVLSKAAFGSAAIGTTESPKRTAQPRSATPVEILSKPQPAYTEEARRLRVEGEVLIELLFKASGEPQVIRIVRGLGHGLDEAAVAGASAIRFRPATHDGVPVDQSAVVHFIFQLAY